MAVFHLENIVRLDFIKSNPILRMHFCTEGEMISKNTKGVMTSFAQILDKNRENFVCKHCFSLKPKLVKKVNKKSKVFVVVCKVCKRPDKYKTYELTKKQVKAPSVVEKKKGAVTNLEPEPVQKKKKKRKKEENAGLIIPPKMPRLSLKLSAALNKANQSSTAEDRLKKMFK